MIPFGQQVPEKEVTVPETARDFRELGIQPAADGGERRSSFRSNDGDALRIVTGKEGSVGPAGGVQRDEEVQALGTQRGGEG